MTSSFVCSAVLRAASLYLLWIALAGVATAELVVGVPVVLLAVWASLRLLPPARTHHGPSRAALRALAMLVLRLPLQSLVAGIDVARRAISRPLRLQPGEVVCACALPRAGAPRGDEDMAPGAGIARGVFRVLLALQPGSLPVAEREDGALIVHCLDVTAPVADQLAHEEALFSAAIGPIAAGGRTP
ncbi:Na+/H+ antiporter subunit E [Ancylobacter pratisalsi]|uniref:Na+/H+ antiporter subunit E n=1 Tax=Ancylobacter pratisalsi TaxID=1745854 RepID=A0A6P1YLT9_9HYPH|nr:Na+/H+ antiporter subunit E [Ancylobacter pratisalsi]QIB33651.1 Na+/H+ antiporter subunit E [Ancylobacter pratisalsi]